MEQLRNKVQIIKGIGVDPVTVDVEMGDTVRQVLSRASMQVPNAKDIRVNGQPAGLDSEIMPGDSVSFLPKIEGGLV